MAYDLVFPGGALDFFSDVDETSNGPGDVKALIEAAKRNNVKFADPALG